MATKFETLEQLKSAKLDACYGTSQYYRTNPFVPKVLHTDGIQELAEHGECFWLLDVLATEFYSAVKKQQPDSYYIHLDCKQNKVDIVMEDYKKKVIYKRHVDYTDLPSGKLTIKAGWHGEHGENYMILCLPSED